MKPRSMTLALVCLLGAAAAAQQPAAPGRGRGPQPVDPRVQIRMHHFAETNEDIPYALFVSSKVKKDKRAPMIVTLHGIGGTHTTKVQRASASVPMKTYQYIEVPGGDHGTVMGSYQAEIFAFFAKHPR